MKEIEAHADRLYQKFVRENFIADDFEFFVDVKEKLPYTNVYYLACLVEIINYVVNEEKYLENHLVNLSFDNLLLYCVEEAEKLYKSTDISEYLMSNFE